MPCLRDQFQLTGPHLSSDEMNRAFPDAADGADEIDRKGEIKAVSLIS